MVETFPPGHFYSPIPDIDDLEPSHFANMFADILSISDNKVLPFAKEVFSYSTEFANAVYSGASQFKWCNPQYPPADALAYYGVLRIIKGSSHICVGDPHI